MDSTRQETRAVLRRKRNQRHEETKGYPVERLWMQNIRLNSRFVTATETGRCRFKSDLRKAGKILLAETQCYRRVI